MSEYRDADRTELSTFAQHISIAETMLGLEVEQTAGLHPKSYPEELLAPAQSWDGAWEQLGQARALAIRLGRDVSAYDAALARSGARVRDGVKGIVVAPVARAAAHEAIAALRAAFPEVVVPQQPPAPTTPRSIPWRPGPMMVYRLMLLGVVVVVAVLFAICGR